MTDKNRTYPMPILRFTVTVVLSIAAALSSTGVYADVKGAPTGMCQVWNGREFVTQPCSKGGAPPPSSPRWEREQEEQERINRNNELMRRAKEIMRKADALYDAGRYREALDLYLEAGKVWSRWGVDQYGNTFEQKIINCRSMIYVTDAKAAISREDYERATSLLREAQSINRKHADSWEALRKECESDALTKKAVALINQGKYGEAESLLTQAVKVYPKSSWAYNHLGRALLGQKRYKEAEVFFLQAIQLDPEIKLARYNLAEALKNQKRDIEAEKVLRQLLKIDPNYIDAYYQLGISLSNQDRDSEAESAFRQAIKLNPDDARAHYQLGQILDSQNRYSEGELAYRQAVKLEPDNARMHLYLGRALYKQNKYTEAEAALRQAAKLEPNHSTAHYLRGRTLELQNRLAEAEAAYKKALSIAPDNKDIQGSLQYLTALQQAAIAERHSKDSLNNKPLDKMSVEARKGFDTGGTSASGPSPVDARGVKPAVVSPRIANHPTYKSLQKEEDGLIKQQEVLEKELAEIRQQKEVNVPDRGLYTVEEAKKKQQISNVQSQIGVIKVRKQDFIVSFKEEEGETPKGGKQ
jgi:tetratricopeptide (TPR) repeat protein